MFRYLCRTSFRRRFLLCIVLVLLFSIYCDTAYFKLKTRDEFASMLQESSVDRMNLRYETNFETKEDFMNGLQNIYYSYYGRDCSGIFASCFLFVPIFVAGRCTDSSLRAACATGKSRRKQILWIGLWFSMMLFLICALETAIYMRLLYTHVQRLPTAGQILRLLLMRPLYVMGMCSIPFAFAFLQSTLATVASSVLFTFLWSNRSPLLLLGEQFMHRFDPVYGAREIAMWQVQPNASLILSGLLHSVVWIVIGLVLAYIFYAKSDVK